MYVTMTIYIQLFHKQQKNDKFVNFTATFSFGIGRHSFIKSANDNKCYVFYNKDCKRNVHKRCFNLLTLVIEMHNCAS